LLPDGRITQTPFLSLLCTDHAVCQVLRLGACLLKVADFRAEPVHRHRERVERIGSLPLECADPPREAALLGWLDTESCRGQAAEQVMNADHLVANFARWNLPVSTRLAMALHVTGITEYHELCIWVLWIVVHMVDVQVFKARVACPADFEGT